MVFVNTFYTQKSLNQDSNKFATRLRESFKMENFGNELHLHKCVKEEYEYSHTMDTSILCKTCM